MDGLDTQELTNGYRERIRRLALFEPLYELERKRERDQQEKDIDMKGLGLLTLLFFFEQKLMRQYKTGVSKLAVFLQQLTVSHYQLEIGEYETIARTIIQTFRPTTGKKRSYTYFNWDTNQQDTIEYSILKANNFDVETNTQFYTLDEDGLELVFATKEFYSEFQLSINQLVLRKQLEKGEFKGALRQINEMVIDVENLEERIVKLHHEIQRSIISEETFERYKGLLEDIYSRLTREDEEFKELRQFVKETRERLFSKDIHKKEEKTYNLILKITMELESVHYDHSRLLERTLALKNTTLITAQESLYYTGIQSFNFDQDIVSTIVSTPLPLEAIKGVLHPFLKIEENPVWSPLAVLAEQNITEEREDKVEQGFVKINQEDGEQPNRKWLMKMYKELMEQFLLAYESNHGNRLSEFMDFLDEKGFSNLYGQRYFYDFWLILHQRSPIMNGEISEEEGKTLLSDALTLLGDRTLTVEEGKGIIHRIERYSIQELLITLREKTLMNYSEETILKAFQFYTMLARDGVANMEAVQQYRADDEIRALLDTFSNEVECVIVGTSSQLFLIPKTKLSPFHVSNDWLKRNYLRSGATNGDIYLLYFATIILFGSFYDSYQSIEPTRQFLRLEEWVRFIQERIDQLKTHDKEEINAYEKEFSYNWSLIIEKWEDMDVIKETAKKQSGNTISRFSFMDTVKRFLLDQELIQEIGNDEITLTEKAKTIIQRFFMEMEYNKGIFEFIYGFEKGEEDAGN